MKKSDKDTVEIKSLQILLKEYEKILSRLNKMRDKELKRLTIKDEDMEALTEQDIQDEYGWCLITEEEYYAKLKALKDYRDGKKSIVEVKTPVSLCIKLLKDDIRDIKVEIRELEFELLSDDEKEKLRAANEEIRERVRKRRASILSAV